MCFQFHEPEIICFPNCSRLNGLLRFGFRRHRFLVGWYAGDELVEVVAYDLVHCRSRVEVVVPHISTILMGRRREESVDIRIIEDACEGLPRGKDECGDVWMRLHELLGLLG